MLRSVVKRVSPLSNSLSEVHRFSPKIENVFLVIPDISLKKKKKILPAVNLFDSQEAQLGDLPLCSPSE